MEPDKVLREDYEYERKGSACILLAYDLDTHLRYVEVRKRRIEQQTLPASGSEDYAQFMHTLMDTHYSHKEKVHIVQDNLNTHQMGSFYANLDIYQAHALKNKCVFHFTPKHGSWLK